MGENASSKLSKIGGRVLFMFISRRLENHTDLFMNDNEPFD